MLGQEFNINMIPGKVPVIIHLNQFDVDVSSLTFNLFKDDGSAFSIPTGAGVLFNGRKPDGNVFSYDANRYSGNTCVFSLQQQVTAVAGDTIAELRIKSGNHIIGTANFILRIEESPVTNDSIISKSYIPLIEQAVEISDQIANLLSEVRDTKESVDSAAASVAINTESARNSAATATRAEANVLDIYDDIASATARATTAASNATSIYNTVRDAYEAGELKGDKGDKGDTGESGVVVPIGTGLFTLAVDDAGDLWCYYDEGADIDGSEFTYDSTTGNLYYEIDS